LHEIFTDKEFNRFIIEKIIYKNIGDKIETFKGANAAIGILLLQFPDRQSMTDIMENMDRYVKVEVK